MRRCCAVLPVAVAIGAAGCGNPAGPFLGSGRMTASVNGVAWTANAPPTPVYATYYPGTPPLLALQGFETGPGTFVSSITLNTCNVLGPGTYALGVAPSYAMWMELPPIGGTGGGASGTDSTHTGTVTIAAFSDAARHAAGTFYFTTGGALPVTVSGSFDVTFAVHSGGGSQC